MLQWIYANQSLDYLSPFDVCSIYIERIYARILPPDSKSGYIEPTILVNEIEVSYGIENITAQCAIHSV